MLASFRAEAAARGQGHPQGSKGFKGSMSSGFNYTSVQHKTRKVSSCKPTLSFQVKGLYRLRQGLRTCKRVVCLSSILPEVATGHTQGLVTNTFV